MEYPKWLYSATAAPVIVADPFEHAAMGAGWAETPAAFTETAAVLENGETPAAAEVPEVPEVPHLPEVPQLPEVPKAKKPAAPRKPRGKAAAK